MEHFVLIENIQKGIIAIYKNENLTSLRGLHNEYDLKGRNILTWHSDVTRLNEIKYGFGSFYYNNLNDLFFCSDEILYFTAHLYLYRPYMNNPLLDYQIFYGREIFPNHQNIPAKRYNMFADIVSQKLYNYWDRIGDLIETFFPNKIKPNQIYFLTVIDIIPPEFHNSLNYQWLTQFKKNHYKKLNELRKQIVHYNSTDTQYNSKHLEFSSSRQEMETLHAERESLPEFYKEQIKFTIEGFEKTLLLLEEINLVNFP